MFPFTIGNILPLFSDWSLLALRLIAGLILMAHGFAKVRNPRGTMEWFASVGFRPGWLWGSIAMFLEGIGGLAIFLGILVAPFAAFLAVQFIVIVIWRLARRAPLIGGYELDIALLGIMLALLTLGPGVFTIFGILGGGQ